MVPRSSPRSTSRAAVAASATLMVALAACTGPSSKNTTGPVHTSNTTGHVHTSDPAAKVFFGWTGRITEVDLSTHSSHTVRVPELLAGDPPYLLARVGDRLAFWGYNTYVLDPTNIEARPTAITRGSRFFVPAANPGMVWAVWRNAKASTPSHFVFSTLREVSTRGRIVKQGPAHGDWWLDGAISAGPVFETTRGLTVWDPVRRRVLGRVRDARITAASFANTLVWCNQCASLHFTNPITGTGRTVGVPPGYTTFSSGGSFSRDGELFATCRDRQVPAWARRSGANRCPHRGAATRAGLSAALGCPIACVELCGDASLHGHRNQSPHHRLLRPRTFQGR